MAILNSAIVEWRFGSTSSNNYVNTYEVEVLPAPIFAFSEQIESAIRVGDTKAAQSLFDEADHRVGNVAEHLTPDITASEAIISAAIDATG